MQNKATYLVSALLTDSGDEFNDIIKLIDSEDLHYDLEDTYARGVESERHVTILYANSSFIDLYPQTIHEFMQKQNIDFDESIRITELFVFDTNPKYDVIVAKVSSDSIVKMNNLVVERLNYYNIKPSFPEYKPHVTLAYVKKGLGKSIVESITSNLENISFEISSMKFKRTLNEINGLKQIICVEAPIVNSLEKS